MATSSSDLTEFIEIERETVVREPGGGLSSSWSVVGAMYAEAKWVGGGESSRQGALRYTAKYRFSVYARQPRRSA
jgi:head-tail adaptor